MEKIPLRKKILELRKGITQEKWLENSNRIQDILFDSEVFSQAEIVLCYVDYRNEVETKTILSKCLLLGKKVFCPKVECDEMEFYQIKALSELKEGFRGILEPDKTKETSFFYLIKNESVPNRTLSHNRILMIMPGAVYDKSRHRIGYGGGYYDKYISKCISSNIVVNTVALGFSFQVLDNIPTKTHDISPGYIITEKGMF